MTRDELIEITARAINCEFSSELEPEEVVPTATAITDTILAHLPDTDGWTTVTTDEANPHMFVGPDLPALQLTEPPEAVPLDGHGTFHGLDNDGDTPLPDDVEGYLQETVGEPDGFDGDKVHTDGFPAGWGVDERETHSILFCSHKTYIGLGGARAICLNPRLVSCADWLPTAKEIAHKLDTAGQAQVKPLEWVEKRVKDIRYRVYYSTNGLYQKKVHLDGSGQVLFKTFYKTEKLETDPSSTDPAHLDVVAFTHHEAAVRSALEVG